MTIAEIARRTGLKPSRLRYVVDRKIVQVSPGASHGRGSARFFSPKQTVAVALAAVLIDRGISKRFVAGFVFRLLEGSLLGRQDWITSGDTIPKDKTFVVELAGHQFVRYHVTKADGNQSHSPWYMVGKPPSLKYLKKQDTAFAEFKPPPGPFAWFGVDVANLVRCLTQ